MEPPYARMEKIEDELFARINETRRDDIESLTVDKKIIKCRHKYGEIFSKRISSELASDEVFFKYNFYLMVDGKETLVWCFYLFEGNKQITTNKENKNEGNICDVGAPNLNQIIYDYLHREIFNNNCA